MNEPHHTPNDSRFPATGVGSLPFSAVSDAFAHVRAHYGRLPFLPELPRTGRSPAMLRRILPESFLAATSQRGTDLRMTSDDPAALALFLPQESEFRTIPIFAEIAEAASFLAEFDPAAPLRISIAGPCTMTAALKDLYQQPLWHVDSLRNAARDLIVRIIEKIVDDAGRFGRAIIVQIDEPMLGHLFADIEIATSILNACFAAVRKGCAKTALHTCSRPIFPLIASLPLDYLSIDLVDYGDDVRRDIAQFEGIFQRGTSIVAGVVPAFERERTPSPIEVVESILAAIRPELRTRFLDRLVLSATCGTLLAPIDREREIAALLEATAEELRRRYPL